jgi:hypothetical protein
MTGRGKGDNCLCGYAIAMKNYEAAGKLTDLTFFPLESTTAARELIENY